MVATFIVRVSAPGSDDTEPIPCALPQVPRAGERSLQHFRPFNGAAALAAAGDREALPSCHVPARIAIVHVYCAGEIRNSLLGRGQF